MKDRMSVFVTLNMVFIATKRIFISPRKAINFWYQKSARGTVKVVEWFLTGKSYDVDSTSFMFSIGKHGIESAGKPNREPFKFPL
jgi:hypothetical protein